MRLGPCIDDKVAFWLTEISAEVKERLMAPFQGFSPDVFALYGPPMWSSNVHNLARMRSKDNVESLATLLMEQMGPSFETLSKAASDEVPTIMNQKKVDAQWIYWSRDEQARKALTTFLSKTPLDSNMIFHIAPWEKHIALALMLRQDGLWTGLTLAHTAVVDRRNFASKLQQSWEREALLPLLHDLPESMKITFADLEQSPCHLTGDDILQWSEGLRHKEAPFTVGQLIDKEALLGLEQSVLLAHLQDWLGKLLPIYRFAAWTPDNDSIEAKKQLQEEKANQRRQASGYKKGDKVRFVAGLFHGKTGVVQAAEAKAQVKVQVGTMSVVVPSNTLSPAGS